MQHNEQALQAAADEQVAAGEQAAKAAVRKSTRQAVAKKLTDEQIQQAVSNRSMSLAGSYSST